MNDREDTALGISWVLYCALMLGCLVGAFILPPRIVFNKWIGCVALVGFFIGIPVLTDVADRSRISDAIRTKGGEVVRLK